MAGLVGAAGRTIERRCLGALRAAILGLSLTIVAGSPRILLATDLAPGGAVVLNEIQYNPPPELGSDELYEYVELHNRSPDPVDVSAWRLKDRDDDHTFNIPEGTVIPPHGYLVVARDADAECEFDFELDVMACSFECLPPPICDGQELIARAVIECDFLEVKSLDFEACTFECNEPE